MSSAYYSELASKSIHLCGVLPMKLRQPLPQEWDEGKSMISPPSVPEDCKTARKAATTPRRALSKDRFTYHSRTFGAAFASLHRRHHDPTIVKLAELMLHVEADLERHPIFKKQEPKP